MRPAALEGATGLCEQARESPGSVYIFGGMFDLLNNLMHQIVMHIQIAYHYMYNNWSVQFLNIAKSSPHVFGFQQE